MHNLNRNRGLIWMLTVPFKSEYKFHVISCSASSAVYEKAELHSDSNVHQSTSEWQTVSIFIEQPNLRLAISQIVRATRRSVPSWVGTKTWLCLTLSWMSLSHKHLRGCTVQGLKQPHGLTGMASQTIPPVAKQLRAKKPQRLWLLWLIKYYSLTLQVYSPCSPSVDGLADRHLAKPTAMQHAQWWTGALSYKQPCCPWSNMCMPAAAHLQMEYDCHSSAQSILTLQPRSHHHTCHPWR